MKISMQKANMLAENIHDFIKYVSRLDEQSDNLEINRDKLYQIRLFIEEFKFRILADELLRINRFEWDEKYTSYLVEQFTKGLTIINEYVNRNKQELFLITARLYTLTNFCSLLSKKQ